MISNCWVADEHHARTLSWRGGSATSILRAAGVG
jgi:hypothetical protein